MANLSIEKINELIEKEMEFANQVNPQMAMGMAQIKKVLNDYHKEISTPFDEEC